MQRRRNLILQYALPKTQRLLDNIASIMLKHLGTISITNVARLMNLTMSAFSISSIWKFDLIIPILKPSTSSVKNKSYRPISLLSPLAKFMEKLVLRTPTERL